MRVCECVVENGRPAFPTHCHLSFKKKKQNYIVLGAHENKENIDKQRERERDSHHR